MRQNKEIFQEIAKMGRLIGCATVFAVGLVYIWASAFFTRPVSMEFIWHQLTSRWLLMVLLIAFLVFLLVVLVVPEKVRF